MAPVVSELTVLLRPDRSVTQLMLENVSNTDPSKVICEDTLTGTQATYGNLRENAFKAAYTLRYRYDLSPGDIVSIISRSCVGYILACQAIWAAGGTVSTINHSSTVTEIAYAIQLVKPKFFIVDASVKKKLDQAIKLTENHGFQVSQVIIVISRVDRCPLFPDDFITSSRRIESEAYALDGKDARKFCAAIVLSSGTTGSPKAVMLSHFNLVAICEALRAHNLDNWRGSMREVFFPPLSHIYGLYVCALMGPWLGCYICVVPTFNLDNYCKLLQDTEATLVRLVPTVALALAESKSVEKYTYPKLEYFSCAAAPLTPSVATKLRRKFPGVSICQTYGCTELSSCVSQSGVRDKGSSLVATGTLLANVAVRFVDEQGHEVPVHTAGEICVSSPTIMMGYKGNESATRESMLEPGWYRTGDIGYMDSMGYLIVVDRIKDVIKYKGFQVSPTELEEIISQHPRVEDSAVTSLWEESEATEVPRAFVVPTENVHASEHSQLAKEIQDLVASKVAGYKKLRGGVMFTDKLPRNPTGKFLRRQLRESNKLKAKI